MTPDWVKWLFTSPADELNVTVIEFSVIALSILSQFKYERLEPATPVESQAVSAFLYREGTLIFGTGCVKKVIGEVIEYTSNLYEEFNCGLPLLNDHLKVVGIRVKQEKLEERVVYTAINI